MRRRIDREGERHFPDPNGVGGSSSTVPRPCQFRLNLKQHFSMGINTSTLTRFRACEGHTSTFARIRVHRGRMTIGLLRVQCGACARQL